MRLTPAEEFPKVEQTPTDDLIAVYKTCLNIEHYCKMQKIQGVAAVQLGFPWALAVLCFWPDKWTYLLNYSYQPLSDKKIPVIERFINVEQRNARYFKVERYESIEYRYKQLVVENQPELIEQVGQEKVLGYFIQSYCDFDLGKLPHQIGVEHWIKP